MAEMVTMPKLGFDMAEGTLVRWVKQEGEKVAKGDVLAEIETDKATVEVAANHEGVMLRHLVEPGASVPVGTPIAVIAAEGEEISDHITGAIPAPEGKLPTSGLPHEAPERITLESVTGAPDSGQSRFSHASPLAKRMAGEHHIDLAQIKGSGPGGRVVRRDIEAYLKMGKPKPPAPAGAVKPTPAAGETITPPQFQPGWIAGEAPPDERVPLNRLRAAIGRRMQESKQQLPHFYLTSAYDVEALMSLRKQVNTALPEVERLSVNDFIIRAAALALRRYPNLNASLEGDAILRHGHVNIGVAVAVEGGLLIVVCRDADIKPLRTISSELRAMVERARLGKVHPEDIEGSTFSISNLGMFGIEDFAAIINPPEAAILAVGSVRQTPVIVDGVIRPGWRLKATLSADHRITDGAEAAQFLQALGEYLENPARLLL